MAREFIRIDRVADHSFLASPITPASVVVDLGINTGAFATAMIARYGCAVIGVEPAPQLFATLPATDRLTAEQLAITSDGGPITLYLNQTACATIEKDLRQPGARAVEVEGVTLETFLDRHRLDQAQLVKVDIEGAEISMIESAAGETLQRVDQFTIEFHDFIAPALASAVRRAKERLRAAGFVELSMSRDNSDVLFINRSRITFATRHRALAAMAYKYPRGIARNLDRRLRSTAAAT